MTGLTAGRGGIDEDRRRECVEKVVGEEEGSMKIVIEQGGFAALNGLECVAIQSNCLGVGVVADE